MDMDIKLKILQDLYQVNEMLEFRSLNLEE